jgi:hypothetical protein
MKYFKKLTIYILFSTLVFQGCSDDSTLAGDDHDHDHEISTPTTYQFASRFVDNESSVSYTGQVVRNVLIKDLKSLAGTAGTASASLEALYNVGAADSALSIINGQKQTAWGDFDGNTSKISNKIATDVLIGYDKTPDAQMKEWFGEVPNLVAANSDGSRLVQASDSLELNQMVGKGLLGVVSYYQATSVYLPRIDEMDGGAYKYDNTAAVEGKTYTQLEHYWDEAFGYFGAAQDYNTYADDAARKSSYDTNADGSIDYKSEYNFAWATYAAKRDIDCAGTCTINNDFTGTIMGAFLEGRTRIHNEETIASIVEQRTIIVNAWEKMIAANIIHYAHDVISRMSDSGNKQILHSWAEMRAFAMALQYNQYKLISTTDLSTIITDMGTAPPAPSTWSDYSAKLTTIISTLQSAYSLDAANITAW